MYRKYFVWLICATLLGYQASWAQAPVTDGVITLNAAIKNSLAYSPQLKSAGSTVLASKGERLQAGVRPNPEIGVEAENLAGRGPYKGADSAEITSVFHNSWNSAVSARRVRPPPTGAMKSAALSMRRRGLI